MKKVYWNYGETRKTTPVETTQKETTKKTVEFFEDSRTAKELRNEAKELFDSSEEKIVQAQTLTERAEKLESEAELSSSKARELLALAERKEAAEAACLKEKRVQEQEVEKEEKEKEIEKANQLVQKKKKGITEGLIGKKIEGKYGDYTGALKVIPVEDEDGEIQPIISPMIASYYDPDFVIVPVWVEEGKIDYILSVNEAVKYFN